MFVELEVQQLEERRIVKRKSLIFQRNQKNEVR